MAKKKRTRIPEGFGDKEVTAAMGSQTELDQKETEELEEITGPEAVSPPEEEESSEKFPSLAEKAPYTVGSWRGFTQWQCNLCPWDTLKGEVAMLEHLASAHAPPPELKSPILIAKR